jgi:hypothetical protein
MKRRKTLKLIFPTANGFTVNTPTTLEAANGAPHKLRRARFLLAATLSRYGPSRIARASERRSAAGRGHAPRHGDAPGHGDAPWHRHAAASGLAAGHGAAGAD